MRTSVEMRREATSTQRKLQRKVTVAGARACEKKQRLAVTEVVNAR